MENNRISAVIVAHFIMKKKTICHIFVISDTEVMKLFTQSERHTVNTYKQIIITRFSWLSWQPNWNKTSLIGNKRHTAL